VLHLLNVHGSHADLQSEYGAEFGTDAPVKLLDRLYHGMPKYVHGGEGLGGGDMSRGLDSLHEKHVLSVMCIKLMAGDLYTYACIL
jgi:hypothetical protein